MQETDVLFPVFGDGRWGKVGMYDALSVMLSFDPCPASYKDLDRIFRAPVNP